MIRIWNCEHLSVLRAQKKRIFWWGGNAEKLLEKNISQQNVQKTVQLTYGGGS
jgi:hypothetical protein